MAKAQREPSTLEGETYVVRRKDKLRLMQIVQQVENRSPNEA